MKKAYSFKLCEKKRPFLREDLSPAGKVSRGRLAIKSVKEGRAYSSCSSEGKRLATLESDFLESVLTGGVPGKPKKRNSTGRT